MRIRNMPVLPAVWGVVFAGLMVSGCAGRTEFTSKLGAKTEQIQSGETSSQASEYPEDLERAGAGLDEIAELERSGGFVPGLGIAESKLREQSGDYAGAVIAVYKELSWAYSHGLEGITREAIEEGLSKIGELDFSGNPEASLEADKAARAALAFFNERWAEARGLLSGLFAGETEPDSFSRWMLLVCSLEAEGPSRETRSAYGSVRARYAAFPEYWYRGARAFTGPIAGDYAERCVNLAGSGPYASECRSILALTLGLNADDGKALRTRFEIEGLVQNAVNQQKPELLADLLPLAALPDNVHTVYASGVLRALSSEPLFKNWFNAEAKKARGRLAERLNYIGGASS
jgi:hypothetical protein